MLCAQKITKKSRKNKTINPSSLGNHSLLTRARFPTRIALGGIPLLSIGAKNLSNRLKMRIIMSNKMSSA